MKWKTYYNNYNQIDSYMYQQSKSFHMTYLIFQPLCSELSVCFSHANSEAMSFIAQRSFNGEGFHSSSF